MQNAEAPDIDGERGCSDARLEEIRRFWDADAPTYDNSSSHRPRDPAVQAAWTAALARVLPSDPSRVLDVGAGTGFLSLIAARLGHDVTAFDLSTQMLEQLRRSASEEGLDMKIVVGNAEEPPVGFDVIMERHLLWTLRRPDDALRAWRRAAHDGRLVLVESLWGRADPFEAARSRLRGLLRSARGQAPDHHSSYSDTLRTSLPLGTGTPPATLVEMAERAGWRDPRLDRLRDVEWAERCALPTLERLMGVTPRFSVVAD